MDLNFEEVHFCYMDGLNDAFSAHVAEKFDEARPHILVLDMFGEDLAYMHHQEHPSSVAEDLFEKSNEYREICGVPVVMVMSAIRRGQQVNCLIPVFDARINAANTHMQTRCLGSDFVCFRRMKGFQCFPNGQQMPIECWSANGVVPGPGFEMYGFLQYRHQVKSALLKAIPRWIAFNQ